MPGLATSHIWLNGHLVPSDAAHISVYDRGFQLGDGVFEALRARRGVAIEMTGHMARLHRSMSALGFDMPFDDATIEAGIAELLAAEGLDGVEPLDPASEVAGAASPGDAAIRITVSRGFEPTRGVRPKPGTTATIAIQAWPYAAPSAHALEEGKRLICSCIHRDPESPMAGIKSTSRAELVFASLEAQRAGADDAIFLTVDGRLTEATTSNLLVVSGGTCSTPRLGTALLAGTTRAWLMEHGQEAGLTMAQGDLRLEDVFAADEMAVCSAVAGIVPVVGLDGRAIGNGRPGPKTLALRRVREDWIDRVSIEGARSRIASR